MFCPKSDLLALWQGDDFLRREPMAQDQKSCGTQDIRPEEAIGMVSSAFFLYIVSQAGLQDKHREAACEYLLYDALLTSPFKSSSA